MLPRKGPPGGVILLCFVACAWALSGTEEVLECLRREYTLRAVKTDLKGRHCWDTLKVATCWGRCDSFEIPDWRFPYKISYHPVCVHDRKVLRRVMLRNCEIGADRELALYEFLEAESCTCRLCNSSDTFCDWRSHVPLKHTPYDSPSAVRDDDRD
ncbi:thyrostimulin beta-5 subunit-like [Uloborus diversus]|uniref:thyrostimulin beta-5 subunit-like n=1 Tax=Uloborus diversus TaxID=327109 RepID=UPI0024092EAF|nr:thyrostimulin beta-5 subunit-like [Uloborus diversus]